MVYNADIFMMFEQESVFVKKIGKFIVLRRKTTKNTFEIGERHKKQGKPRNTGLEEPTSFWLS